MMRRFVFKLLLGFLTLVCVLTCLVLVHAAEFQADLIQKKGDQVMKSKFYIKGNKTRMETGEGIVIMDLASGKTYTLQPEQKMYIEMEGMTAITDMGQIDEELAKIADKKQVGTEKVDGYSCDKYEILYHDTSLGKMTQWYSKKLDYPIKMVYYSSFGDMVTEYKNIKEGGVSDSLFELPADYKKMSIPGMLQGMDQS